MTKRKSRVKLPPRAVIRGKQYPSVRDRSPRDGSLPENAKALYMYVKLDI